MKTRLNGKRVEIAGFSSSTHNAEKVQATHHPQYDRPFHHVLLRFDCLVHTKVLDRDPTKQAKSFATAALQTGHLN